MPKSGSQLGGSAQRSTSQMGSKRTGFSYKSWRSPLRNWRKKILRGYYPNLYSPEIQ